MWVEPKKMDDPQVCREAFLSSGLDIDRIMARAQQDDVKQKLIENTSRAVERGTFGSPTFFVGDEIYFGKDSLCDVEDEIVAQLASARRKPA
jgi:2-hydroxychromene-2-carboxylate isomerase